MRMVVVAPLALMLAGVWGNSAPAAGRGAADICVGAGYRTGTAAFDMCVARISGDDPLSALGEGETGSRGDGAGKMAGRTTGAGADPLSAMAPAKPPVAGMAPGVGSIREELPASFNAPTVMGGPPRPPSPPSTPSATGGGVWPTPPTAPTLPVIAGPVAPAWNFGAQ